MNCARACNGSACISFGGAQPREIPGRAGCNCGMWRCFADYLLEMERLHRARIGKILDCYPQVTVQHTSDMRVGIDACLS